ncbi:MAG: hypothetical protein JOS17DRAFT_793290 [Linnemannia elongata]|nr:MAG: hypothetical protein JOS17DRAFT_793290 [Linnemannia elongata]
MLRRDPTRIELRAEDLLDFDRAREEYLDATGANNTSNKNKHKATTAVPPPTPANQTTTTAARKPDPFELAERERKGKDSTMETRHVSSLVSAVLYVFHSSSRPLSVPATRPLRTLFTPRP